MARMHRTLLVGLAIAIASPAVVLAQSAGMPCPAGAVPGEPLTAQEREVLAAAEQLAAQTEQLIEYWIDSHAITEVRMFARLYFPIARSDPQQYSTPYEALADRDIVGPEDQALARSPKFLYAILSDINGYVPAYSTRSGPKPPSSVAQAYTDNRTKRMLGDPPSLLAARSEAHYLIQRTKLETGDVVYDLSVPVTVRGKHWGCVRIGFHRAES